MTKELSEIEELLNIVQKDPVHRNYWYTYKKIQKIKDGNLEPPNSVKLAFLSSFTIDNLVPYMDIKLRLEQIHPQIKLGGFNQYQQEILNDQSFLYKFEPDLIILAIELETILPSNFLEELPKLDSEYIESVISSTLDNLTNLVDKLEKSTSSTILLFNFIVPKFSPMGILDDKMNGPRFLYKDINYRTAKVFRNSNQTFVVDINEIAGYFGKGDYTDKAGYYRGSLLFADEFVDIVSEEIMGFVKALKAKTRKCIVLDLDNTLWGGIIGEDGYDGIKLNKTYPGKEYVDFQKSILAYYNRGIILAINSKNNYEDAMEVINNHPFMILREKHFAALRINWQDKVQNLIEIADDLNIGLDSLVFIDDNPVERERVKQSLPQVKVLDLPRKSYEYNQIFDVLNDFDTFSLSSEDMSRGEKYSARRKRSELHTDIQSIDDFLKTLEMKVQIRNANEFSIPRITSLVNRTNQFNLTTRRFKQNEIEELAKKTNYKIFTVQVMDKFGDEGIVGLSMVSMEENEWDIVNFMMSCRVVGRKIESIMLNKVLKEADRSSVQTVKGQYIRSKKNKLVQDFYENHGFTMVSKSENGSDWEINPKKLTLNIPHYIKVEEDEF